MVNMKNEQRLSLLSEIATLYYEKHMTQAEIAKMLFVSRPSISRLLQQAEDEGIVEIKVNYYLERNYHLEEVMKKRFQLKEVLILGNQPDSSIDNMHSIGRLAAEYLRQRLQPGMTLGLSWGRSVASVVNALPSKQEGPIKVAQIMGATINEASSNSAQQLIRRVADAYDGQAYYLNAPLFVEDDYVCQMLRNNPAVSNALHQAANADIILTGIGIKENDTRHKTNQGGAGWLAYMNDQMIQEINERQAVGSIAAQFFNAEGVPIDCLWARNCIGIGLNELKKIPEVIGVAVGRNKTEAIYGAILGRYISVLVTDFYTASEILQLAVKKTADPF